MPLNRGVTGRERGEGPKRLSKKWQYSLGRIVIDRGTQATGWVDQVGTRCVKGCVVQSVVLPA